MIHRSYLDTPEGQLHWASEGEGAPLVLLHSSSRSLEFYRPLVPLLSGSRRVISVDTPGFGNSYHPPRPFTIEQYAERIVDFADRLELATFDLLGSHTGAAMGIEIAATRPERIHRLGLIGTPYFATPEMRAAAMDRVGAGHISPPDETNIAELWESNIMSKWRWDAERRPGVPGIEEARAFAGGFLADLLRAGSNRGDVARSVFSYNAAEKLGRIRAPTLVVGFEGEADPELAMPPFLRQSRVVAGLVPAGRLEILPAANGAVSMLTALRPLAALLDEFFA
jgi:pimeloyl-ACP methyl ester carboxylesterase